MEQNKTYNGQTAYWRILRRKFKTYQSIRNISLLIFSCFGLMLCAFTNKRKVTFDVPNPALAIRIDSVGTVRLENMVSLKDPVCGMDLRKHFGDTTLINGKLYGFCSPSCKEEFLKKMNNNSKHKTKNHDNRKNS